MDGLEPYLVRGAVVHRRLFAWPRLIGWTGKTNHRSPDTVGTGSDRPLHEEPGPRRFPDRAGTRSGSLTGTNSDGPLLVGRIHSPWKAGECAVMGFVVGLDLEFVRGLHAIRKKQIPRCARPGGQARNDNL